ncbi:MAG: ABC transporter permease [Flexilinea sp.]
MGIFLIIASALSGGTILLFGMLGGIFTERSGVMNLAIEGYMLIGATISYKIAALTGSPWIGLLAGILAAAVLGLLHALICVTLKADQVVSGLAINFVGTGVSMVLGANLSNLIGQVNLLPTIVFPALQNIPTIGQPLYIITKQNIMVYIGLIMIPIANWFLFKTRPGMHLRAIGENPEAADAMGLNVNGLRYLYTVVGAALAGIGGVAISTAIYPGWFSELTTNGKGWICVGLVIFSQWNPVRGAFGAYFFGLLSRVIIDIKLPRILFGMNNPFFFIPNLTYFLEMVPYIFTLVVMIIGANQARRKRIGAPAALGQPFSRGQRGK